MPWDLKILNENLIATLEPITLRSTQEQEVIRNGLKDTIGSVDLDGFLVGCKRLLIIVNDATRKTPTYKILEHLQDWLEKLEFNIIIATGSHKKPDDQQLKKTLASFAELYADRIIVHDALEAEMTYLGTTSRGTPVKLNKIVEEVDRIIAINSVEPHYFAGYTGGRKSLIPGIASYETIEKNHSLALENNSKIIALKGNPVHEDMTEAALILTKRIFSINLIIDSEADVYGVYAGDLIKSFQAAVDQARKIYVQKVPEKADILLAFAQPPLNEDLYQAQKGIENNRLALKEGGILILVATCQKGVGKKGYYNLLTSCKSPEAVMEKIKKGYLLGYHKAAKIVDFQRYHQLWMITKLPNSILDPIRIRKFDQLSVAVEQAFKQKGNKAGVIINRDAALTVPFVT